jgi:hypothetical protein
MSRKKATKLPAQHRAATRSRDTQGTNPAKSRGDEVEEEYRHVVEALNRGKVSFTVRSAEGITLYAGLDSHKANGHMREIARNGHFQLAQRVNKKNRSKADARQSD